MKNFIASFYNPTLLENTLLATMLIVWFLFIIFCFIAAVYILLLILSKMTNKDLSFERFFLNEKIKRIYPKLVITTVILIIVAWAYYGLVDN